MQVKGDSNQKKPSGMSGQKNINNSDNFLESGDWEVPEMLGKKRRGAVGELIKSSPHQAVSVIRGWLNKDQD